jgi:hypothetical protein
MRGRISHGAWRAARQRHRNDGMPPYCHYAQAIGAGISTKDHQGERKNPTEKRTIHRGRKFLPFHREIHLCSNVESCWIEGGRSAPLTSIPSQTEQQ